jgi:hypothetical protein
MRRTSAFVVPSGTTPLPACLEKPRPSEGMMAEAPIDASPCYRSSSRALFRGLSQDYLLGLDRKEFVLHNSGIVASTCTVNQIAG